jgi:hypothetical protein
MEPDARKRQYMVTGVFRNRESAERAYDALNRRGYKPEEVHVLMTDETRKKHFSERPSKLEHGTKSLEGAAVGAGVGGAIGATLVGILAAASTLTVPGLGLVIAGPIAGALAGASAGGAAGGLVGALVGAGIPEERARTYEKDLKEGGIVLGVTPRSETDAEFFEREWATHGEHVYR